MAKFKPLPPLAELREKFDYDPETGIFLRKAGARQKKSSIGKPAGYKKDNGYIAITVRNELYFAHRLAWYICTEMDPGDLVIDHINKNRSDNTFANLRLATVHQNSQNTTGLGCSKVSSTGRYQAYIYHNRKKLHLGMFSTAEEAQAAYDAKAVELRGEFAPQECLRRASQS